MDWDSPVQKNEFAAPSTRERGGEMQQIEENEGIRAAPLGCDDESNLRRSLALERQADAKKNRISLHNGIVHRIGQLLGRIYG